MHDLPDDKIKQRLERYVEEPDEALWERIVTNVPPRPSLWTKPVTRTASLLAMIILLTGLYYLHLNSAAMADLKLQRAAILPHQEKHASGNEKIDKELFPAKESKMTSEQGQANEDTAKRKKGNAAAPDPDAGKDHPRLQKSFTSPDGNSSSTAQQDNLKTKSGAIAAVNTKELWRDFSGTKPYPVVDSLLFHKMIAMPALQLVNNKEETVEEEKSSNRQDDPRHDKIKVRKGSLYFLAMPTFGYNRIEPNKGDNIIIESVKRVPHFSMKRLGVRLEAGFEYPVSGRVSLSGGVLYYQRKQTLNYTEKVVDSVNVTSFGENGFDLDPQYSYVPRTFEYEVRNIGVHAGMNYLLAKGKFVHSLGTGIEFQRSVKKTDDATETARLGEQPPVFLFYNLFYRLQYPAEGKFRAIFQPTLNYSFYVNDNTNAPFYIKPYGLGLNIGVSYKF